MTSLFWVFHLLFRVEQEQGITVLEKAIMACTEAIEHHKGKLVVKETPRAVSLVIYAHFIINISSLVSAHIVYLLKLLLQVSERDDKLLAEHMAKLRQDNEEISGDEDSEEEEDTGMGEVDVENAGSGITE